MRSDLTHALDSVSPRNSPRYANETEAGVRLADDAVPRDNSEVESQIRSSALDRSNWLSAGSLRGVPQAAASMSLIQPAPMKQALSVCLKPPSTPQEKRLPTIPFPNNSSHPFDYPIKALQPEQIYQAF